MKCLLHDDDNRLVAMVERHDAPDRLAFSSEGASVTTDHNGLIVATTNMAADGRTPLPVTLTTYRFVGIYQGDAMYVREH